MDASKMPCFPFLQIIDSIDITLSAGIVTFFDYLTAPSLQSLSFTFEHEWFKIHRFRLVDQD
jgi:hypothetical protein